MHQRSSVSTTPKTGQITGFLCFLSIIYYAAASANGIMIMLVAKGKKKTTKNAKYSKIRRTTYKDSDE